MLNSNFSVGDMNFNYRLKLETLSKHALASSDVSEYLSI